MAGMKPAKLDSTGARTKDPEAAVFGGHCSSVSRLWSSNFFETRLSLEIK